MRATLLWQPTDSFQAVLRVTPTRYDTGDFATLEVMSCSGPKPITSNLFAGTIVQDPFGDCKLNGNVSHGAIPAEVAAHYPGAQANGKPYGKYNSTLSSLNMQWTLDNFTVSTITGFYDYNYKRFDNFDGTVYSELMGLQIEQHTSYSQEVRLMSTWSSPINFMVGAYYEHFKRNSDNRGKIIPFADPITGLRNNWSGESTVKSKSWSAVRSADVGFDPTARARRRGALHQGGPERDTRELLRQHRLRRSHIPQPVPAASSQQLRRRQADPRGHPHLAAT